MENTREIAHVDLRPLAKAFDIEQSEAVALGLVGGLIGIGGGMVLNALVVGERIVEHGGAANLLEPLLRIGAIEVVGSDE